MSAVERDTPRILLPRLPHLAFMEKRARPYPGLSPIDDADWIVNYADTPQQLDYRARLISERRKDVIGSLPEGEAAAGELFSVLIAHLDDTRGWSRRDAVVQCPGHARVELDEADPLGSIGRLVSEDFCILMRGPRDVAYRLVAAVVCFPSNWSLADKMGRSLSAIHDPVPDYDEDVARRVNRVFDGIRTGGLMVRHNWILQSCADLHAPPRPALALHQLCPRDVLLRSERQTFRRLEASGAVAFGIRTSMAPLSGLDRREVEGLIAAVQAQSDATVAYKGGAALRESVMSHLRARLGP